MRLICNKFRFLCISLSISCYSLAFSPSSSTRHGINTKQHSRTDIVLNAKGFGKSQKNEKSSSSKRPVPAKTYGGSSIYHGSFTPLPDVSDITMMDFFDMNTRWWPMFRELSMESCQAIDFFTSRCTDEEQQQQQPSNDHENGKNNMIHEHEQQQHVHVALPDKPSNEKDMSFLSAFLDSMHQSLLDIPITTSLGGKDDDNDIHFMEEGRRLMAIQRFHVVSSSSSSSSNDLLFETCWSEIYELKTKNDVHTGSLILVPHISMEELDHFCMTQVVQPLEWLGLRGHFEVASLQRDSPAIRLLYQLQEMPEITDNPDTYG